MALDLVSLDFAMKELYSDKQIEDLSFQNRPLLALLPKEEDFYGDVAPLPVIYGNPQGRSANFARAQARGLATGTSGVKFNLTRVRDYSVCYIDNETMEASENDRGAFIRGLQTEADGAINSLSNSLAISLFRGGFGDIGVIGSFTGATITLSDPADAMNFEVGMELVLSLSVSANVLKANGSSGNGLIVTGVDRDLGVLTFGANVNDATNGVPTIANGDVIFVRGDRQDSATPAAQKISGLAAWVPQTAPGATQFFGVARNVDPVRLGGLRYDARNVPIEEALIDGQMRVFKQGGNIDYYIIGVDRWSQLEKALGAKVQYVDVQASENIGFRGLKITGPKGDTVVLADPFCPEATGWGITRDTWVLKSLKKAVRPLAKNGSSQYKFIDQATADGVEIRFGYYAQLGCRAPGRNINIRFA